MFERRAEIVGLLVYRGTTIWGGERRQRRSNLKSALESPKRRVKGRSFSIPDKVSCKGPLYKHHAANAINKVYKLVAAIHERIKFCSCPSDVRLRGAIFCIFRFKSVRDRKVFLCFACPADEPRTVNNLIAGFCHRSDLIADARQYLFSHFLFLVLKLGIFDQPCHSGLKSTGQGRGG